MATNDMTPSNYNADLGYDVPLDEFDADFGWLDEYAEDTEGMWSDVEQGMYDDDPSPYTGDYSEM